MSTYMRKKVLSRDSGDWLLCCWDECEKNGYELHKCIQRTTNKSSGIPETVHYVFCSERHRQYFLNGHRAYGMVS